MSSFRLVVVQNIDNTLNENENEAWKKLLSVMTHEIMNSIAPITSLAETLETELKHTIEDSDSATIDNNDLLAGISSIKNRSAGLMRFAKTYRSLNNVSQINKTTVNAAEFLKSTRDLMLPTVPSNVDLRFEVHDEKMDFEIDSYLIEQVLINLLINAVEASNYKDHPKVIVRITKNQKGKPVIAVLDNGTGISDEIKENIFVPFFSTKKRGSGAMLFIIS